MGKGPRDDSSAFDGEFDRSSKKAKLHIGFDDGAREEYLTGFRKRKTERRKQGLAWGKLKERKARLQERKQRREEDPTRHVKVKVPELKVEKKALPTVCYDTEEMMQQWGDVVTVTTSLGLPDEEDGGLFYDEKDSRDLTSRLKEVVASTQQPRRGVMDDEQYKAGSLVEMEKKINLNNVKKKEKPRDPRDHNNRTGAGAHGKKLTGKRKRNTANLSAKNLTIKAMTKMGRSTKRNTPHPGSS